MINFFDLLYFYPRPPRGGRPPTCKRSSGRWSNFYPRPPRGGRPLLSSWLHLIREFLSTPSARRATEDFKLHYICTLISIHALREEGDKHRQRQTVWKDVFLSTPSARRATCNSARVSGASLFLSTPSARRATNCVRPLCRRARYFYPRPPRGGRRKNPSIMVY